MQIFCFLVYRILLNIPYFVFLVMSISDMFSSPIFFPCVLFLSCNQFTRHVLFWLISLLACPTSYMTFPAFSSSPLIACVCIWSLFYSDDFVSYRAICCMAVCRIYNRYRGFNINKTLIYFIAAWAIRKKLGIR